MGERQVKNAILGQGRFLFSYQQEHL